MVLKSMLRRERNKESRTREYIHTRHQTPQTIGGSTARTRIIFGQGLRVYFARYRGRMIASKPKRSNEYGHTSDWIASIPGESIGVFDVPIPFATYYAWKYRKSAH